MAVCEPRLEWDESDIPSPPAPQRPRWEQEAFWGRACPRAPTPVVREELDTCEVRGSGLQTALPCDTARVQGAQNAPRRDNPPEGFDSLTPVTPMVTVCHSERTQRPAVQGEGSRVASGSPATARHVSACPVAGSTLFSPTSRPHFQK